MPKNTEVKVAPKPPPGLKLHQQRAIIKAIHIRKDSLLRHFEQGTQDANLPRTLDTDFCTTWSHGKKTTAVDLSGWPLPLQKLFKAKAAAEQALDAALTKHNAGVCAILDSHQRKTAKVRNLLIDKMSELELRVTLNGMGDMGMEFLSSLPTPENLAEYAKSVDLTYDAAKVQAAIELDTTVLSL